MHVHTHTDNFILIIKRKKERNEFDSPHNNSNKNIFKNPNYADYKIHLTLKLSLLNKIKEYKNIQ